MIENAFIMWCTLEASLPEAKSSRIKILLQEDHYSHLKHLIKNTSITHILFLSLYA